MNETLFETYVRSLNDDELISLVKDYDNLSKKGFNEKEDFTNIEKLFKVFSMNRNLVNMAMVSGTFMREALSRGLKIER